jgi:hypothetical protein
MWEEGRMRAVLRPEEAKHLSAVGQAWHHAIDGDTARESPGIVGVGSPNSTKTDDVGHRWLGATEKKSA